MPKPTLNTLETRLDAVNARLDAAIGKKNPPCVFVPEGVSIEDAARNSRVKPGQSFRPFRWRTQAEQDETDAEQERLMREDGGVPPAADAEEE